MLVAGIAGNAAIAGICVIASNWEGTGLSGGGISASFQGSRYGGDDASSEHSLAVAIAGIASNRAIAGNSASGQPVVDEDVGVLEPDHDGPADF